jgi:hypothetical protein
VERVAPTETAAATTTSTGNYCITLTGRSPEKEGWYLDCATTSHICGCWQNFEWYAVYSKRQELEIQEDAARVAGKDI